MVLQTSEELDLYLGSLSEEERKRTAIWLLCHYPNTRETDVRCERAAQIVKRWKVPVWLFGTMSARFTDSVESLIKAQLVKLGVPAGKVICSADIIDEPSLDTVQELNNVVSTAKARGVANLVCVSNPLQLLQVYGFVKRETLNFVFVPTLLRDWRVWYLSARLALIPLAFAKIGGGFAPLKFVRHARAKWASWPL